MKKITLLCLCFIITNLYSQDNASIKELVKTIQTYPYSDPNPIAQPDNYYYPYFRFDGFAHKAIEKAWKVVELENDYIKISILPEIGGKIWGAIEKSTGEEFIYSNSVVKFRDIAMRGAWTSGGIELNFGVIGHAPTSATPVDYYIRTNADGSVSCFLSATDFFTQTRWETEVNLPKDKAYFTTNTVWHNPTPLVQPYYQWMNAAYQVNGDLEFCFPGSNWIGHDGSAHSWPFDDEKRDLSWYKNNDFGGSKSHHVLGGISDFYAAYWHDLDFGSGHYAPYGEKLGMKVFLWAHSRSGGIWEDLLTDTDGQYVELQSGRLFNQAVEQSTKTPFKHVGFSAYETDVFKEYWFPVINSKGVLKANPYGSLNVEKNIKSQTIYFSPLQKIKDEINIYFGEELKYTVKIDLKVLETWQYSFNLNTNNEPLTIVLGNEKLVYSEKIEENITNRPMESPIDFDWNSVYGLYLNGLHWIYQNKLDKAEDSFKKCLAKDGYYAPALNQIATLYFRKGNWEKALEFSKKSLSMNAYDAEANFIYGLTNRKLNKWIDAQDGFAVASLSPTYRDAANIELSKLFIGKKDLLSAKNYADKVLFRKANDQEANLIMAVIHRKTGNLKEASAFVDKIRATSPLNQLANFEAAELMASKDSKEIFLKGIKNEMPHETLMDLSDWYTYIGCYTEAIELLEMSSAHPLVYLKLAYLYKEIINISKSDNYLQKALDASSDFVFPFRKENLGILQWANKNSKDWKPKYYLGLLYWSLGDLESSKELFKQCGNEPDSYSFYISRKKLFRDDDSYNSEKDLLKSFDLGKSDWRTSQYLIDYYLDINDVDKALKSAEIGTSLFPSNDILKYQYATCLLSKGEYAACRNILEKTTIIPSEGARYGRLTYHQACVMEAIENYNNTNFNEALNFIVDARKWPENLGAGKPYDLDETVEDFMEAECLFAKNKKSKAKKLYQKIIDIKQQNRSRYNSIDYLYLLSKKRMEQQIDLQAFFGEWKEYKSNDLVQQWCEFMIQNDTDAALQIESEISIDSGGTVWNPRNSDAEFEIVKAIAKSVKIN